MRYWAGILLMAAGCLLRLAGAEQVFAEPFADERNFYQYSRWANGAKFDCKVVPGPDGANELMLASEEVAKNANLNIPLDVTKLWGKTATVKAKVRAENLKNSGGSARFVLNYVEASGDGKWPTKSLDEGSYGWREIVFPVEIPDQSEKAGVSIALQGASGKLFVRDLEVTVPELPVIKKEANVELQTQADAAPVLFESKFDNDLDLKQFTVWQVDAKIVPDGDGKAVCVNVPERCNVTGIFKDFDAAKVAGKKIRFEVEVKGENIAPARDLWNGGKIQFQITDLDGKDDWKGAAVKLGTFDWEQKSVVVNVPGNLKKMRLFLGFQDSSGKIYFRNLKMSEMAESVDLTKVVNMDFADDVAGDGKGGWSDQGPFNDAKKFKYQDVERFANVPFTVINPAKNNGKAVLVMNSPNFPNGPKEAVVTLARPAAAKYLYLLHTLCFGSADPAGIIKVMDVNGKTQTVKVVGNRDLADWWGMKKVSAGVPGATWSNGSGGTVGLYVSGFALDDLAAVKSITFESSGNAPVWLVVAATLSADKIEFPSTKVVRMLPDERWQALSTKGETGIVAGTAIDRAKFVKQQSKMEWIIVNKDGKFAYASHPDEPVRFLSGCEGDTFKGRGQLVAPQLDTKEKTEEYVRQLKLHGYNLTRIHFADSILMTKGSAPFEFDPVALDRFDYFIKCLKDNSIYLNLDAMASPIGYLNGDTWSMPDSQKRNFKFEIYFDPAVRENWKTGFTKVLTRINPYTQTRLVDEPLLAMATGFNEQEFAFFTNQPEAEKLMKPDWQKFLQTKYGTMDNLKKAWGSLAPQVDKFDQIPLFRVEYRLQKDQRGTDILEYMTKLETEMLRWYNETARAAGFKGQVANYDMGQSLRYSVVRKDAGLIFMHAYHAHPSNYTVKGSTIDQSSSFNNASLIFRGLNSAHQINTPIVVTEYGNVFWNQYRYEQSFANGAYAALNGFDGLTFFAQPIAVTPSTRMHPFSGMKDPIIQANEFLTSYMFCRGDVGTATKAVRLNLDAKSVIAAGGDTGVHPAQSRFSLLMKMYTAVDSTLPLKPGEIALTGSGGAAVMNDLVGYTKAADKADVPFDLGAAVANLKQRGMIPAGNRTDPALEIFESVTGELYMDCRKNLMTVNTPKLQGVCGEAGTKIELADFAVDQMTRRGNLSVVSIENVPVRESKQLVLVIATNALNYNMLFDDKEQRVLRDIGGPGPVLVDTGVFTVRIRSNNAASLKLYVLEMDGTRRTELPVSVKAGWITAVIDTGKLAGGPAVYFELASK